MTGKDVEEFVSDCGGTVEEIASLPDGSGFAVASFPLPVGHWLTCGQDGPLEPPPMHLRCGKLDPRRAMLEDAARAAVRYAVRAATSMGTLDDFDPDALVQNAVVGLVGYYTTTGLVDDEWANPSPVPDDGWSLTRDEVPR